MTASPLAAGLSPAPTPGSAAPAPRPPLPLALGVFVLAFAVYALLAAPGVDWLDAGELAAAGATLGVSHPPGQPLHALLGRAAAFLPFGELAFRVTLVSALAAAAATAWTFTLVRERLPGGRATRVAAVVAALLVGASPLVVDQATRPEVYAPALALIVLGLRGALAFAAARGEGGAAPAPLAPALVAAFAFALAAALHPLVAAMAALPAAVAIVVAGRARLPRLVPAALALGALGLLAYAYLPLRAGAATTPLLDWGEPDTWARFRDVVTGKAYGQNFAAAGLGGRTAGHLLLLGEGSGLPLLLLGSAGLAFAALTRLRGAATALAVTALVCLGAAAQRVFYVDNPDIHGYLAPALVPLALGLAALLVGGARALARVITHPSLGAGVLTMALAAPVVALGAIAPTVHASGGARRGDAPATYADTLLLAAPAGPSLVIAESDHALFPTIYERVVAGVRPDVAVGNTLLATSSWFLTFVKRQRPELFVPYVDDGGRTDRLGARLVGDNVGRGRGVLLQHMQDPAQASARRLGYLAAVPDARAPALPLMSFADASDALGRRVARFERLGRAAFEARAGRFPGAARALGLDDRLGDEVMTALAHVPRGAKPMWSEVPSLGDEFISAPWQEELVLRDLLLLAGYEPPPPAASAPGEVRLLWCWQLHVLGRHDEADVILAELPRVAWVATIRWLTPRAPEAAAKLRTQALARWPGDAELERLR